MVSSSHVRSRKAVPPYHGTILAARIRADESESGARAPSNSPSFSGESSHGTRNGISPATACWISEIQSQLENSISRTPIATQCIGGWTESPCTISSIKARPTAKTAVEPIQYAAAQKNSSRAAESCGLAASIVVPPEVATARCCCCLK